MKVVTALGARPQFIKASVVSAEFAKCADMEEIVVHTGQHFDANMSDVFFAELGMPTPKYQLDIHGGGHGEMTGRMLTEVERVLWDETPDVVLVYGGTNSTLAGGGRWRQPSCTFRWRMWKRGCDRLICACLRRSIASSPTGFRHGCLCRPMKPHVI